MPTTKRLKRAKLEAEKRRVEYQRGMEQQYPSWLEPEEKILLKACRVKYFYSSSLLDFFPATGWRSRVVRNYLKTFCRLGWLRKALMGTATGNRYRYYLDEHNGPKIRQSFAKRGLLPRS